jgi:hypothetical protein
MKKLLLATLCGMYSACLFANGADSTLNELKIKNIILADIQQNLEVKSKTFDSTIIKLDTRISKLDSTLRLTESPKEKIDKLIERVQVLEQKQKAQEEHEQNVYEANYQSAIINLASMDREIKPLVLFQTARDFFDALNETTNPSTYDGYNASFAKFKEYIDKIKDQDAAAQAISDMADISGGVALRPPLTGSFATLTLSGMSKYINSIGHKKRDLKKESMKMFSVTTKLCQFTADKNMIESEWETIIESLYGMEKSYDTILNQNLAMLNIKRQTFTNEFTKESDANMRYAYLTTLRQSAADYVSKMKETNPKNWKENIYYQLIDVQSLKIKYGDVTLRISEHMNKYGSLVEKYKRDKDIGGEVVKLGVKLDRLKETFDNTFEPGEYAHTASRMYKVL